MQPVPIPLLLCTGEIIQAPENILQEFWKYAQLLILNILNFLKKTDHFPTVPVSLGIIKVLFIMGWLKKITFNDTHNPNS